MSKVYTRDQLRFMGFDESQIDAIMAVYDTSAADATPPSQVVDAQTEKVEQVELTQSNITSITDLQKYAAGTIVRLPDFAEGQPFIVRLRRPSMLVLAKQGKIPNSLLNTANELFVKGGGGMDVDDNEMLGQIYDVCKVICAAALMQPTMAEIEAAGIELSDDQLMAIFNYTQNGIKALEPFRK